MQKIMQLGDVRWVKDEIVSSIPEFLKLYEKKPLSDNEGGMKSPHMLATWFMLKKLNPKRVIESGVWKGQGTWLIQNTLPQAKIFSIDINLNIREYISDDVTYYSKDFGLIDWSEITDKQNTLLFFDDHQNAFERIKLGKELGFKHFIFEDNYPAKQGDCYSLKKVFQHAGFDAKETNHRGLKSIIKQIFKPSKTKSVLPNSLDSQYLEDILEIYYEFPPVFKSEKTRWGDNWTEDDYPTVAPLYNTMTHDYLKLFYREAAYYNWICYAKLK